MEADILDAFLVKYWGLKFASNAACTVLRVDQVIEFLENACKIFYWLRAVLMKEVKLQKFNPSRAKPTKWSNILKQFVGNSRGIVSVVLTVLWVWRLKG